MDRRVVIAIDADGTIFEHKYPNIGALKPNAVEVINGLSKEYYIIIWTCRGGQELEAMRAFLDDNSICYDKINENAPWSLLKFQPFPKVYADIYIDDRNLGGIPEDWLDIYKLIKASNL